MKKALLNLSLIAAGACSAQPIVYFDFVTHNEETTQWNGTPYYTMNRARLVSLANYFHANGITWNMQSDWVYLTNVLTQETTTLKALTANKNILQWMQADKGVEMDPHAHESQYIYPDVVKLMDSIGLPESKIIGGSIYNDSNGINIWTNLINGQWGVKFPSRFWQPKYMMGGGTPNHVADIKYYGIWNPQSPSTFTMHDTSQHLRQLGVGCSIKIKDDTDLPYVMAQVHELMNNVQSGVYPASGHYFQTIFFEQGDLNGLSFYNTVTAVADSINAIVATGKAQWKTMKQAYTIWETTYGAQAFQWDCGQVATGVTNITKRNEVSVFPNPSYGTLTFEGEGLKGTQLYMYDLAGNMVVQSTLTESKNTIDIRQHSVVMYFYRIARQGEVVATGKVWLQ